MSVPTRSLGFALVALLAAATLAPAFAAERPGDGPPDLTPYNRPLVAAERRRVLTPPAGGALVDLVVSAFGAASGDTAGDGEPSIAIDPNNPNNITISAFSGGWGANAPLWNSTDGGATWTEDFTVPQPPGWPNDAPGCPCDQTFDYGRNTFLYGTFLGVGASDEPTWSGDTSNPLSAGAWQWHLTGGVTDTTSHTTFSDQPWLMVNRDPTTAAQDNVYVGYTDYGIATPANHVSYSLGANPPDFPAGQDVVAGTSSGTGFLASAAIRIATDPSNGSIYAVWEDNVSLDTANCARNVDFRLSRSTDHGQTWTLNGSGSIVVATHQSDEGWPDDPNQAATACRTHVEKFGTVNALLGGSEAVAVDPTNGDVYYVYHDRDGGTGNNRLEIARLTPNGSGGLQVFSTAFVTGQVQAALPAVAVASNGTIGVLYDTYDGVASGFPQFTVHLAQSTDHGATFVDLPLVTFLSPTLDNGNARQRILGDYQQMKAIGNTFYAAFPANGATAGRSISNIDPFFLKVQANPLPVVATGTTFTGTEGTALANQTVATFADPGGAGPLTDYSADIDWGDGTASSAGTITVNSGVFTVSGGHTYADEGTFSVTVTIHHTGAADSTATSTAQIADADVLSGTAVTIHTLVGVTFSGVVANFTDTYTGNSASDFTATIDWGDGSVTPGTIAQTGPGAYAVSGSHTWNPSGAYFTQVTLTDDPPGTATATAAGEALVNFNPAIPTLAGWGLATLGLLLGGAALLLLRRR